MGTSLSGEVDPSQAEISRTPSSTQDTQQFGNHTSSRQSIKDLGENVGAPSIGDKTADSVVEMIKESKGESSGMDDMTVGETEAINVSSETGRAANST